MAEPPRLNRTNDSLIFVKKAMSAPCPGSLPPPLQRLPSRGGSGLRLPRFQVSREPLPLRHLKVTPTSNPTAPAVGRPTLPHQRSRQGWTSDNSATPAALHPNRLTPDGPTLVWPSEVGSQNPINGCRSTRGLQTGRSDLEKLMTIDDRIFAFFCKTMLFFVFGRRR